MIFLLSFYCAFGYAQNGDVKIGGDILRGATSKKNKSRNILVLDSAKIRVFYELKFKEDSTKNKYTEAQMILLLGNKKSMYSDYYAMKFDSISYFSDAKTRSSIDLSSDKYRFLNEVKNDRKVL